MFQFFPQIQYSLISGQTLAFTDIFRSVKVVFSNPEQLATTTNIAGERADQISSRLYGSGRYYWTLFFTNNIKNPLKEWGQSEEAYTKKIEAEYDGFSYQLANTSIYLPNEGSPGLPAVELSRYEGTDLNGITVGDLIIVETGNGSYSLRCLGAGVILGTDSCASPHYGQSIIPEDLDTQNNIKQISCGSYFSSALDQSGTIYAWGQQIGLDESPFGFNPQSSKGLYKSKTAGYTFINASGNRIIAILTSDGGLTCFGNCSDFNQTYGGETGFIKTYWTSGISGGLGIKENGTVVNYGLNGPSVALYDADCGFDYCVGIQLANYGLTGWGGQSSSAYLTNYPSGITGFTGIAAGYEHNLAVRSNGEIYAFGISAEGRTIVPSGSYKKVSAGKYHSAAIDSNDELVIWGKITKSDNNCFFVGTPELVTPKSISGTYDLLNSGLEHLLLKSSGTVKKYIGIINSVDNLFKKINAKPYQYPDVNPILVDNPDIDPSGTVVSIWRYNQNTGQYEEVKTIQHKLLTIQKYLDSVLYVQIAGNILDPSVNNNWLNTYIPNYQNADDEEGYITLRKQLMDQNVYNRSQTKYLSLNGAQNLESIVNTLVNDQTISSITSTEL